MDLLNMLKRGQRLCCCAECAIYSIDSGLGEINGRIVSNRTYALHQKPWYVPQSIAGPQLNEHAVQLQREPIPYSWRY